MGCITTIMVCIYGDFRTGRLDPAACWPSKSRKESFADKTRVLACIKFELKLTFGRNHQSRFVHGGSRDSPKHNIELRQVFQGRGCRRGPDATHTRVLTYLQRAAHRHYPKTTEAMWQYTSLPLFSPLRLW